MRLENPIKTNSIQTNRSLDFDRNLQLAHLLVKKTETDLPIGSANRMTSTIPHETIIVVRDDVYRRVMIGTAIAGIAASYLGLILLASCRSSSSLSKNELNILKENQDELNQLFIVVSVSSLSYFFGQKIFRPLYNETSSKITCRTAKFHGIGNCFEQGLIAFEHLKKISPTKGEVIVDMANDHVFLVIDRDPVSSIEDPKTWGEQCVICDPWAGDCYKPAVLKDKLALFNTTYLSTPNPTLKESNFYLIATTDNQNILTSSLSTTFSNVLCMDLHFKSPPHRSIKP